MKRVVLFSFLTVALVFSMAQANAGPILNINVDEFGNGTSNGSPLPALFETDPSGGVAGKVLVYQLPFVAVQGDLYLNDSATAVVIGDVLRFFTVGNTGLLIFYSDFGEGDPADALADSGLPQSGPNVTISEVGPEGANGAVYTPASGKTGAISADFQPTYNILSDSSVPEPGSVLLIAAGLGGLGLLKRR